MNYIITQRLEALRQFMNTKGLNAFIIPSTDAHLSEYPATHWSSREWISGFDGSAGTVVITHSKAALWTDSRYFIQAAKQLEGTPFLLQKEGLPDTPSIDEWLKLELAENQHVGIDSAVYAAKDAMALTKKLADYNIQMVSDYDPFEEIWIDRPPIPQNPVYIYPEKFAGDSSIRKISSLRQQLERVGADFIIIPTLDTIAWLFNIRGNDVDYNPVTVSFACVSKEEAVLFVDSKKMTPEVVDYLHTQAVVLADYTKIYDYVSKLNGVVCIDSSKLTLKLYNSIPQNVRIVDMASPVDLMKAIKNETEIEGFRTAMVHDGVALVKFLMWLETQVAESNVTEMRIAEKLIELRSEQPNFVGESFGTIAGYGANGAIVHYNATPESSATLQAEGSVLVDSGGQYFDGTTDITRTISIGETSQQFKLDYTMVLKGHINLATVIFPQGTRGSQLDILARKTMWDHGLNYLHGTGHGVGHFMNVHEGPHNIRMNENPVALVPGMVMSNEPGLYRTGEYGIRIENLIAVRKAKSTEFGEFYSFETLTLCPIDTTPIVKDMLSATEIEWLNNYHKYVYDKLSPSLNDEEKRWLKQHTNEI